MEQATVEQAEPQGQAAPTQDTSAPASGGTSPASDASFGSIYKQHVIDRVAAMRSRAGVSSAEADPASRDEQPAPSTPSASRPGADGVAADVVAPAGADSPAAPAKPSRAQRKAAYQQAHPTDRPAGAATADTTPTAPEAPPAVSGDDPVAARVAEAVQPLTEGLSRIEGLLKPEQQAPPPAPGSPEAVERELFGDEREYQRRREIAEQGSLRGQYLDASESDELALWSSNRKARDFAAAGVNRQYQSNFSAMVLAAAEELGVPVEQVTAPGTTFRDIFTAFVSHGAGTKDTELAAERAAHDQTKAAMQQLADENEALRQRLPASARTVLGGGSPATSRAAAVADRSRMNGRQAMRAGLERAMQGRTNRPGAR